VTYINEGFLTFSVAIVWVVSRELLWSVRARPWNWKSPAFGPVNVSVEGLTLEGTGFNDLGAIRNVKGNNSWAGAITQAGPNTNLLNVLGGFPVINSGTTFYRVDRLQDTLTLSGAITGNVEMIKTGDGTLELSGITANTSTQATRILRGTLLLNKEPGINAGRGSRAYWF